MSIKFYETLRCIIFPESSAVDKRIYELLKTRLSSEWCRFQGTNESFHQIDDYGSCVRFYSETGLHGRDLTNNGVIIEFLYDQSLSLNVGTHPTIIDEILDRAMMS